MIRHRPLNQDLAVQIQHVQEGSCGDQLLKQQLIRCGVLHNNDKQHFLVASNEHGGQIDWLVEGWDNSEIAYSVATTR